MSGDYYVEKYNLGIQVERFFRTKFWVSLSYSSITPIVICHDENFRRKETWRSVPRIYTIHLEFWMGHSVTFRQLCKFPLFSQIISLTLFYMSPRPNPLGTPYHIMVVLIEGSYPEFLVSISHQWSRTSSIEILFRRSVLVSRRSPLRWLGATGLLAPQRPEGNNGDNFKPTESNHYLDIC